MVIRINNADHSPRIESTPVVPLKEEKNLISRIIDFILRFLFCMGSTEDIKGLDEHDFGPAPTGDNSISETKKAAARKGIATKKAAPAPTQVEKPKTRAKKTVQASRAKNRSTSAIPAAKPPAAKAPAAVARRPARTPVAPKTTGSPVKSAVQASVPAQRVVEVDNKKAIAQARDLVKNYEYIHNKQTSELSKVKGIIEEHLRTYGSDKRSPTHRLIKEDLLGPLLSRIEGELRERKNN